ncbi:phosphogluconate dehydratase [Alkalicaulis satelles]|uniref:Phosphogluconate dehydratase n=1 Tax=Alkalicaulis satelles TaxID=2609175 RepID=A0A5M6ZC28_9PROT|nr:phosphogluconate dehydratase [Alkalicaulis satelles]KAA5802269.1 phosphogluconate dehydratase [Alkalicaulis satelles]
MTLHPVLAEVTARIEARSRETRAAYLDMIARASADGPQRKILSCGNLAHGFAASGEDKPALKDMVWPNVGIVSAFNDMLSAHQPMETYPARIKAALRAVRATGQVAGGTPAMCDGVTQGQPGMELSLFSRDVIAMATAVSLSHNMFDAAICLGTCDKIVPGLLIGALRFGHLPVLFLPAGPMPSGLPNPEKARIRQLYAEGKADRAALLDAESASYHSPGTCTFYGTANSNQMLMEIMGLHVPGSAFIPPGTPLRDAMIDATARRAAAITALGRDYRPLGQAVDARAIVNAIVGLHATGGSTNHALHLPAIARAAGLIINWDDFDALSQVTPLLAKIYPNGPADVNHFHAAGGLAFLIRELMDAGLLHRDVLTLGADALDQFAQEPGLDGSALIWRDPPRESADLDVLRPALNPVARDGGLRVLSGRLGRAVIKVSAVKPEHRAVTAPCAIFDSQDAMLDAFRSGALERDVVVVVRFQGPRANGMPELHKLTPALGVLQDRGFKVALVTDGRMSGASGKVPAAIHVTPEALTGGPLARLREGDVIRLDAGAGVLELEIDEAEWAGREPAEAPQARQDGFGRELFSGFRQLAACAEEGGLCLSELDGARLGADQGPVHA